MCIFLNLPCKRIKHAQNVSKTSFTEVERRPTCKKLNQKADLHVLQVITGFLELYTCTCTTTVWLTIHIKGTKIKVENKLNNTYYRPKEN